MRVVRLTLLTCGAVLLGVLVNQIGPAAILSSLTLLSWRLLVLLCFPFALVAVFDTLGWQFAFRDNRVPFHALALARLAGEAFNTTTPTASVGGEPVKAWLLRRHVPFDQGLASVIIAKTTLTVAQGLFLLVGITLAWWTLSADSHLLVVMEGVLLIEIVAVAGFAFVQVSGVLSGGVRLLSWVGVPAALDHSHPLSRIDAALSSFYRREPRRLLLSVGFHFAGWVLSAFELYLILRFLGVPVSLTTATVFEAFSTGIRFATFLIPGSLGALEGGHVVISMALGLGALPGISFSLVRRVREATWAGVGLVALAVMRRALPSAGSEG